VNYASGPRSARSGSDRHAYKSSIAPPAFFPDLEPLADLLRTPPLTTEERLTHIRALGRRIQEYIRFMCTVNTLVGSSAEEKHKAVAAFYEALRDSDDRSGRIQDGLRLG
jgi:hypothetical protein